MSLKDTVVLMSSEDYKDRFKAEYYQTKERYERLKRFNTRIEAAEAMRYTIGNMGMEKAKVEEPKHDCPTEMLRSQQRVMGEYLHILEMRAVIEKINLDNDATEGEPEASNFDMQLQKNRTGGFVNGAGNTIKDGGNLT